MMQQMVAVHAHYSPPPPKMNRRLMDPKVLDKDRCIIFSYPFRGPRLVERRARVEHPEFDLAQYLSDLERDLHIAQGTLAYFFGSKI